MEELKDILLSLGMLEYLDSFIATGFGSWETLSAITEVELERINVKIGHRRKLQ
ncbi:hypothetical protein B0O99DRAFT_641566 [Bisporella sp. PMI_857]|nr:hypothetical protein B0O99DRAFT_641566 [Bisporella sp. PMI_857]